MDKNLSEKQLVRMIVDQMESMDSPELLVAIFNQHLAGENEKIEYLGRDHEKQRAFRHVNSPYEYDYDDPITV